MIKAAQRVLADALQLPQDERAAVANSLLDTLEPPERREATDDEWISEIERRARSAMAGDPGVSWEQGKADILKRLRSE